MSRHTYQYVTLRLVPRIERGEFINVGVVLYSQEADYLDARTSLDPERARCLHPDLDLAGVEASLAAICAVARGEATTATPVLSRLGPRFGWLSAPRSTIVQPGPIHGGTAADLPGTLRHLLASLVEPPGPSSAQTPGASA